MEPIDLLIEAWYVVTMNETRDLIRDGAVAVRGNRIVDVAKASELRKRYAPKACSRRFTVRGHSGNGQHPHPHHR